QEYPALNNNEDRLAYSQRATSNDPWQLFVVSLTTGVRTQLTGPNTSAGLGAQLRNVIHPTWSPGGDRIVVAAQGPGLNVYNLYTVEVSSGNVTQLTFGTNANGVDSQDPAFS